MNFWYGTLCPICRHPFYHFPNVCRLLHSLLLKVYPIAYKRREREVGEEEKEMGHFSPQFDDRLMLSNRCGGFDASSNSLQVPTQPHAQLLSEGSFPMQIQRESSSFGNFPEATGDGETILPIRPSILSGRSAGFLNGETENRSLSGKEPGNETQQQVSVVDVLCDECKNLLFHPVVLNCGHVYCESCIIIPVEGIPKCQICQTLHPHRFPNVCLALEHFLEEYFPKLYSARQESLPSQDVTQAQHQARHSSSVPTRETFADEFMMHGGVGCDSCGMCPIVGQRYKCKDCVEKIGFDLCEACYNNPSKLLGRFNQQHKPEHSFEIVRPRNIHELQHMLNLGWSEDDGSNVSDDEEDAFLASDSLEAAWRDAGGGSDDARDASATLNDSDAGSVADLTRED